MFTAGWAAVLCAAMGVAAWAYAGDYTIGTASVTVKGAPVRVLTDVKGMTLYYNSSDTMTASSCTGACAKIWPALLSSAAPTAEGTLPGKLAIAKTANGSQVAYNGHLLYTYSGDTAPHQANGHGIGGVWWVAAVDVKPAAAAPGSPAKPAKSGGYGW
jgi:predicted lipoprotein with Yx(FWY)xxD motif